MARECRGTTKRGEPCKAPPVGGSSYCYTHDPDLEEERARSRRLGGLTLHYGASGQRNADPVAIRNADDVLRLLETAASDLMSRKPGFSRARGLIYLATSAAKVLETADLAERVAALEASLTQRRTA